MTEWKEIYLVAVTDKWLKTFWDKKRRPSMFRKDFAKFGYCINLNDLIKYLDFSLWYDKV
jgi:hypothetical protein